MDTPKLSGSKTKPHGGKPTEDPSDGGGAPRLKIQLAAGKSDGVRANSTSIEGVELPNSVEEFGEIAVEGAPDDGEFEVDEDTSETDFSDEEYPESSIEEFGPGEEQVSFVRVRPVSDSSVGVVSTTARPLIPLTQSDDSDIIFAAPDDDEMNEESEEFAGVGRIALNLSGAGDKEESFNVSVLPEYMDNTSELASLPEVVHPFSDPPPQLDSQPLDESQLERDVDAGIGSAWDDSSSMIEDEAEEEEIPSDDLDLGGFLEGTSLADGLDPFESSAPVKKSQSHLPFFVQPDMENAPEGEFELGNEEDGALEDLSLSDHFQHQLANIELSELAPSEADGGAPPTNTDFSKSVASYAHLPFSTENGASFSEASRDEMPEGAIEPLISDETAEFELPLDGAGPSQIEEADPADEITEELLMPVSSLFAEAIGEESSKGDPLFEDALFIGDQDVFLENQDFPLESGDLELDELDLPQGAEVLGELFPPEGLDGFEELGVVEEVIALDDLDEAFEFQVEETIEEESEAQEKESWVELDFELPSDAVLIRPPAPPPVLQKEKMDEFGEVGVSIARLFGEEALSHIEPGAPTLERHNRIKLLNDDHGQESPKPAPIEDDPFLMALSELESPEHLDPLQAALAEFEGESSQSRNEQDFESTREMDLPVELMDDPFGVSLGEIAEGSPQASSEKAGPESWQTPREGGARQGETGTDGERPWWMPPEVGSGDAKAPPVDDLWSAVWSGGKQASPTEDPSESLFGEALSAIQGDQKSFAPQRRAVPPRRRGSRQPARARVGESPQEPESEMIRRAPKLSDRRKNARALEVSGKVYFRRRGRIATGSLRDLGLSGCAVLTHSPIPPGTDVPFALEVEGMRTIRVSARVVWCRQADPYALEGESCMGVAFQHLEPEDRRLLSTFLSQISL